MDRVSKLPHTVPSPPPPPPARVLPAVIAVARTATLLLPSAAAALLLAGLTVAAQLTGVELLPVSVSVLSVLARLGIASVLRARHGFNLAAQPLDLAESCGLIAPAGSALPLWIARPRLRHRVLSLLQLLAQFGKTARNVALVPFEFGLIPLRSQSATLHAVVEIGVIHLCNRVAQLL